MEYRYHPIIEGLKVSEDGTEVLLNGHPVAIKSTHHPRQKKPTRHVHINRKRITIQKLVCEAWHGPSPTGGHAARRVDELRGDHYTNLFWGKKGMTLSTAAGSNRHKGLLVTKEIFEAILNDTRYGTLKWALGTRRISHTGFYRAKKRYGKEQ